MQNKMQINKFHNKKMQMQTIYSKTKHNNNTQDKKHKIDFTKKNLQV
jgi:hypothetical protein